MRTLIRLVRNGGAALAGTCVLIVLLELSLRPAAYLGPYTQITVPAFMISYVADCRGLFDAATPQTFVEETVQLSLTRQ